MFQTGIMLKICVLTFHFGNCEYWQLSWDTQYMCQCCVDFVCKAQLGICSRMNAFCLVGFYVKLYFLAK